MRFSMRWLADYVELPEEVEELAERLTFAGLAVEGIETVEDVEAERGDTVLDVDVTTNRPDAMNHFGLAREVAVLTGGKLEAPPVSLERAEPVSGSGGSAAVTIEDPAGCPRYVARLVRGVEIAESPGWLKARLEAIGLRPINNIVDITNFVLWETGQPLHAFDFAKLAGAEIRVRRGREGEKLTTLDGAERALDPEILVIADRDRAVALAGVMGGLDSEVTEKTVDVLIESAHFDRKRIRAACSRLGLHTDASHRFERGADPGACLDAADRAAALIAELAGGAISPEVVDARGAADPTWPPRGRLELARLSAFAGREIAGCDVEGWLSGLGFGLEACGEGAWEVTVPSWRYYDLPAEKATETGPRVYEADIFEEVLRIHGYDSIPSALPGIGGVDAPRTPEQRRRDRLRELLAAAGYAEAINFSFLAAEANAVFETQAPGGAAVELANPLSDLYSEMRRSLVPNLVANARFNRRRGAPAIRLFEVGNVFFAEKGREGVVEPEALALVCGGRIGMPWDRSLELDLFDLKGAVEALAAAFRVAFEAREASLPGVVEGTGARLAVGERTVGWLGQVAEEDAEFPVFAAELEAAAFSTGDRDLVIDPPSRYPAITADLTLTHGVDVAWIRIREAIIAAGLDDLVDFGLKDRYRGKGVPDGAVNSTIYFVYNSVEHSLTQEEINERQQGVTGILENKLGWSG